MIRLVYLLFIFSGFIGLVYESLWARYLKLFLGHSSYGQILTIFIYMGGIGIGSFLGGKLSKKTGNAFLAYAAIELLIGIGGLAYHSVYGWITASFFSLAQIISFTPLIAVGIKISISLLITAPVAILLGMTFPMLAAGVMRYTRDAGKASVPRLYFTNSLGAAIGIMATSYILIPRLGTWGALLFAATGNVLIALGFYFISRKASFSIKQAIVPDDGKETGNAAIQVNMPVGRQIAFWLGISALTGLSSFIYEIGWIRLLSLLLGSSTHSFDIMVSAFILGLAGGGLYAKRSLQKSRNIVFTLVMAQVLMGIFALLSIYLYKYYFILMNDWHLVLQRTEPAYYVLTVFKYMLSVLLMCPTSFFAGMTLPILTCLLTTQTRDEKYTGYVYGWNTIGAITGAVFGGLILLPAVQLKNTIATGALIDIGLGLAILFVIKTGLTRRILLTAGSIMAILPVFMVKFDPHFLTSGIFRGHANFEEKGPDTVIVRDGSTATISFHADRKVFVIRTNGKPDASYTIDKSNAEEMDDCTQAALALFPMSILEKPYTGAIIGMGSGMTAHYLLSDPLLQKLDIVEIEKEMYALARNFMPFNRRAYEDPRVSRIVDDAKTYFSVNRKKYDLIISEPSNPWVSGVSSLFTKEFYHQISGHITENGILVQWMHLYEFRADLLLSIIKALDMTFPYVKIYQVPGSQDVVMIAGRHDFYFTNYRRIAENPGIKKSFPDQKNDPAFFGSRNYLISNVGLRGILAHCRPNSDFFPVVDNGAEKAFFMAVAVTLFRPFQQTVCPYSEIVEPEFYNNSRKFELYNAWPYLIDSVKVNYVTSLLNHADMNSDWNYINKMFFDAIYYTADSTLWDKLQPVQLYREMIKRKIPLLKSATEFLLLDNLIHQRMEKTVVTIEDVLKEFNAEEVMPFLIESMLVTCIKQREMALYNRIEEKFVKDNPRFDIYEKMLIRSLAK